MAAAGALMSPLLDAEGDEGHDAATAAAAAAAAAAVAAAAGEVAAQRAGGAAAVAAMAASSAPPTARMAAEDDDEATGDFAETSTRREVGRSRWASRFAHTREPAEGLIPNLKRFKEELADEVLDSSPALPPCAGACGSVTPAAAVLSAKPLEESSQRVQNLKSIRRSATGAVTRSVFQKPGDFSRRPPNAIAADSPVDVEDEVWTRYGDRAVARHDLRVVQPGFGHEEHAPRNGCGSYIDMSDVGRSSPSSKGKTRRLQLKPHHEQVVSYFFAHAPSACARDQPLRFHMQGARASVYAAIISIDLDEHQDSQYLVLVPTAEAKEHTANVLRRAGLRVAAVEAGSDSAPKQPTEVLWPKPPDAVVCRFEDAGVLQGCSYRIRIVEETDTGQQCWQAHQEAVTAIHSDLVVHFADVVGSREAENWDRGAQRPRTGGSAEVEEASWYSWLSKPYNMLWKALIRPPRARYSLSDLGVSIFVYGNHVFQRQDIQLQNYRGQKLECSHFYMRGGLALRQLCVLYLHGNCSSRLETFYVLPALLSRGLSVFCLDLAGSGWSGGEYISLGYHEEQDVKAAISHLRDTGAARAVALWGRSMGAAAAVLRASQDPDIAACVLDSPFADLAAVVEEYTERIRITIPKALLGMGLDRIREEIKERVGFDPYDLKPVKHAPHAAMPALFGVARDDTFILPHHTIDLHNAWGGDRQLIQFEGGHSGRRPPWFLDQAADFLLDCLGSWEKRQDDDLDPVDGEVDIMPISCPRKSGSVTGFAEARRLFAL